MKIFCNSYLFLLIYLLRIKFLLFAILFFILGLRLSKYIKIIINQKKKIWIEKNKKMIIFLLDFRHNLILKFVPWTVAIVVGWLLVNNLLFNLFLILTLVLLISNLFKIPKRKKYNIFWVLIMYICYLKICIIV